MNTKLPVLSPLTSKFYEAA